MEEFSALKDVSFSIPRGEIVGLIGHNGSGKSTLLKVLSRITPPTKGRVEYRGTVSSLLEVGTGFHPELSGRENIYLNGAILGMPREVIARRFDEIVAFSEVEAFLDTPVKRYSSGMYMRLAFAVAANLESDILLVDEVLAVGDGAFQRKCLGKMKEVSGAAGRTVIFVSHNMQAVQSLCTKVMQLDHGRMVQFGETSEAIRGYLSAMSESGGSKEWSAEQAPGNEEVRLRSVRVVSEGRAGGVHSSNDAMTVEMRVDIKSLPRSLCVGFDLMTADGATVFRSYQTDLPEERQPPLAEGAHVLECRIPAGLLNGGLYYICPRLSVHNQYWIVKEDATVQLEVVLDHGVSPYWANLTAGNRPGLVAPILEWGTSEQSQRGE